MVENTRISQKSSTIRHENKKMYAELYQEYIGNVTSTRDSILIKREIADSSILEVFSRFAVKRKL